MFLIIEYLYYSIGWEISEENLICYWVGEYLYCSLYGFFIVGDIVFVKINIVIGRVVDYSIVRGVVNVLSGIIFGNSIMKNWEN